MTVNRSCRKCGYLFWSKGPHEDMHKECRPSRAWVYARLVLVYAAAYLTGTFIVVPGWKLAMAVREHMHPNNYVEIDR